MQNWRVCNLITMGYTYWGISNKLGMGLSEGNTTSKMFETILVIYHDFFLNVHFIYSNVN